MELYVKISIGSQVIEYMYKQKLTDAALAVSDSIIPLYNAKILIVNIKIYRLFWDCGENWGCCQKTKKINYRSLKNFFTTRKTKYTHPYKAINACKISILESTHISNVGPLLQVEYP